MNILFIHQNFPGQYKHLAPALVKKGHRCIALTLRVKKPTTWQGVRIIPYGIKRGSGQNVHPWVVDFETKVIRAEACFNAARALRDRGFKPDIIIAHPGWGESMFLRDVWPEARIGLYYELYHTSDEKKQWVDPEFEESGDLEASRIRLRLKNINNREHLPVGDMAVSPTEFQADSFPPEFRKKISVIHDGIDTKALTPDMQAQFELPNGAILTCEDEVITFVNRNLEPYRGYHIFMRALPALLRQRPNAQILIVGGDSVSYGAKPKGDKTWKQIFIDEVRDQISDEDWARVHFLGRISYDKFTAMLQVASVHVYLTYPFVLSWSLLETMSLGKAIVASDTAPVREVIKDGKTGVLVDFFDVEGLTDKVSALLDDPKRRDRLGKAARDHVIRNFDLETVCLPKQLEWIDRLAALKPGKVGD